MRTDEFNFDGVVNGVTPRDAQCRGPSRGAVVGRLVAAKPKVARTTAVSELGRDSEGLAWLAWLAYWARNHPRQHPHSK